MYVSCIISSSKTSGLHTCTEHTCTCMHTHVHIPYLLGAHKLTIGLSLSFCNAICCKPHITSESTVKLMSILGLQQHYIIFWWEHVLCPIICPRGSSRGLCTEQVPSNCFLIYWLWLIFQDLFEKHEYNQSTWGKRAGHAPWMVFLYQVWVYTFSQHSYIMKWDAC